VKILLWEVDLCIKGGYRIQEADRIQLIEGVCVGSDCLAIHQKTVLVFLGGF
jgi:hypothetical protein